MLAVYTYMYDLIIRSKQIDPEFTIINGEPCLPVYIQLTSSKPSKWKAPCKFHTHVGHDPWRYNMAENHRFGFLSELSLDQFRSLHYHICSIFGTVGFTCSRVLVDFPNSVKLATITGTSRIENVEHLSTLLGTNNTHYVQCKIYIFAFSLPSLSTFTFAFIPNQNEARM